MTSPEINLQLASKVKRTLFATTSGMVETVASLLCVPIEASKMELRSMDAEAVIEALTGQCTWTRAALDKDYAGKFVHVVLTATDSMTMAATLVTTPEETILERRESGKIDDEDFETFGELANIACSGIDEKLRELVKEGEIGARVDEVQRLEKHDDPTKFGDTPFVVVRFSLKVESHPESTGMLLVDWETAEAWNGGPIEGEGPGPQGVGAFGESLIEADVPHRGTIATYLADDEPYHLVRRACRRVGLDVDTRPEAEVPNPASYKGKLVLIDVPLRNERRFHWCKRLKEYEPSSRVVLMIRHPSRQRVVLGFLSKADVIVGWPVTEEDLMEKLDGLLDGVEVEEEPEPEKS